MHGATIKIVLVLFIIVCHKYQHISMPFRHKTIQI